MKDVKIYVNNSFLFTLTQDECRVIWDALHTFYADQKGKGVLLKSEAESIKTAVKKFHQLGYR